jgi:signal transduction histidine kinase
MESIKTSRETGLPWTIRVANLDPSALEGAYASRRNLLSAGFALIVLVIAAAGYFVFRSVNRELSVARLQSDFVAAVSHEFRTPLTANRDDVEKSSSPKKWFIGSPHGVRHLKIEGKQRERVFLL